MWRTTLAGLRAHARRLVGTAVAVVLGVAFVSGTLIFSATAEAGFTDAFARGAAHIDASVRPPAARGKAAPPVLPAADLGVVAALPGVASAAGRMDAPLALLGPDGRPLTNFGQVGVAVSTDGPPDLRPYTVAGRVPAGPGEALLDTATAARFGWRAGQPVTVVDAGGARHAYTLVGLMDFGVSKDYADRSVVGLPAAGIATLTGTSGYTEIVATARPGHTEAAVVAEIRAALGAGPRVVTGDRRRTDLANEATSVATQFATVLLIFGAVALVVSMFVIYNTFAVLLAQRVRETALLRCVGATRRQVFTATLTEAALLGAAGSAAGVLAGIGVAAALFGLLGGTTSGGLPAHPIVVTPTAVVVGLLVGIVVTTLSALLPAIRATGTSPLAALRDTGTAGPASRRRRAVRAAIAAVVLAAGIAVAVASSRAADAQAGTLGIVAGGMVTFLGLLIALPLLIGPLMQALGAALAAVAGVPAKVAVANSRRNPGRTAVTTGTLMIGIGLMSLFAVVFASISKTADDQLIGHYPVDYVATGVSYGDHDAAVPAAFAAALRAEPRLATVAEVRETTVTVAGKKVTIGAFDPASLDRFVAPQVVAGDLGGLGSGGIAGPGGNPNLGGIVLADKGGALAGRVGDRVRIGSVTLPVVATASLAGAGLSIDALVGWDRFTAIAGPGDDSAVLVKAAGGVSATDSRAAVDRVAAGYPLVRVDSIAGLSGGLRDAVSQLITIFGGLIGVAVLISLFGVGNTLSMSVVERTRESATLRAIGLTRGQLRGTLLVEALLMGLVGALVGITFGAVFGRLVVKTAFVAIGPTLVTPWGWIAGLVALAAGCSAVAAVLPARRAARASIVAAMAET